MVKVSSESCRHTLLIGQEGTRTCPMCKARFFIKQVEVVGTTSGRPVPYWATYIIPTNEHGWYLDYGEYID